MLTSDIALTKGSASHALIAPDTDNEQPSFQGTPFTGSFDGAGFTIAGLSIVAPVGADYLGLFGRTDNAHIKNLTLEGVSIVASGDSSHFIGALIGEQRGGQVSRCSAAGTLIVGTQGNFVGGLVGRLSEGQLVESFSTGLVTGSSDVGGLVGAADKCTAEGCFWDIQTSRTDVSAAGYRATTKWCGASSPYGTCDVWRCHSVGIVVGTEDCGGLIGSIMVGDPLRAPRHG